MRIKVGDTVRRENPYDGGFEVGEVIDLDPKEENECRMGALKGTTHRYATIRWGKGYGSSLESVPETGLEIIVYSDESSMLAVLCS